MDFLSKCNVLGDMWLFYREDIKGNELWEEFYSYNDVALPLAYAIKEGYATIVEGSEGEGFIEETWLMFCDYIDIDPEGEYSSVGAAFIASPNEPIKV